MDIKEIFQEANDELEEQLGRHPSWQESCSAYQDRIVSMIDGAKDRYKYGE